MQAGGGLPSGIPRAWTRLPQIDGVESDTALLPLPVGEGARHIVAHDVEVVAHTRLRGAHLPRECVALQGGVANAPRVAAWLRGCMAAWLCLRGCVAMRRRTVPVQSKSRDSQKRCAARTAAS